MTAHPTPRIVWNASRSAPLGLYLVVGGDIRRDDFVLAQPPPPARELAARRGYLPATVPLVKRVAAIVGDVVCSVETLIIINGRIAAKQLGTDARGRPLPSWEGCFPLRNGEYFLLMEGVPDSFDGRYFGRTDRTQIIGKLTPIWTW